MRSEITSLFGVELCCSPGRAVLFSSRRDELFRFSSHFSLFFTVCLSFFIIFHRLSLIFHHFSLFVSHFSLFNCLSVVLQLDKRDYPENFADCVFVLINKRSFDPLMCLHVVLERQQSFLFPIFAQLRTGKQLRDRKTTQLNQKTNKQKTIKNNFILFFISRLIICFFFFFFIFVFHCLTVVLVSICSVTKRITPKVCRLCFCPNK